MLTVTQPVGAFPQQVYLTFVVMVTTINMHTQIIDTPKDINISEGVSALNKSKIRHRIPGESMGFLSYSKDYRYAVLTRDPTVTVYLYN